MHLNKRVLKTSIVMGFSRQYGIIYTKIKTRYSKSNGMVERFNRPIRGILQIAILKRIYSALYGSQNWISLSTITILKERIKITGYVTNSSRNYYVVVLCVNTLLEPG